MSKMSTSERYSLLAEMTKAMEGIVEDKHSSTVAQELKKCLELFNRDRLFRIKRISLNPRTYFSEPLEMLAISERTRTALRTAFGIELIGELVQRQAREILRVRTLGQAAVHEIRNELRPHGLHLGMQIDGDVQTLIEAAKEAYVRKRKP